MWDVCQEELCAHSEQMNRRERSVLQSAKLEGHLCPLTSDMELPDMTVALMDFSLALA